MITPISFKGTYKLYATEKTASACLELAERLKQDGFKSENDFAYSKSTDYTDKEEKENICMTTTTVVPDRYNNALENFCKTNGISFKRIDKKGFMSPSAIEARIDVPFSEKKRGKFIAKLDTEKLDELLKTQTQGNIKHCESDYKNYYKNDVNYLIGCGKAIPATSFVITSDMAGGSEGAIEYIEKFGDNLNDDSLLFDFDRKTDDADHCVYFGLKDLGMKEIPVSVNRETYKIGQKIGLLK
ncbi:MAG: hypothetical protein Q4F80_06190 [bacterium]|nr:hypothetical protein [bacterium]